MKKVLLIFLTCISFILSVSLVYSVIEWHNLDTKNTELLEEINNYEEAIAQDKNSKVNLEQEYESLKNDNNKLTEYEKWNNWTQEIEQKMS